MQRTAGIEHRQGLNNRLATTGQSDYLGSELETAFTACHQHIVPQVAPAGPAQRWVRDIHAYPTPFFAD